MTSLKTWREHAKHYQGLADERRAAEARVRDERPWIIGLAILAALAIIAFCLVAVGLFI